MADETGTAVWTAPDTPGADAGSGPGAGHGATTVPGSPQEARERAQGRFLPVHQGYSALERLTRRGHVDWRTQEAAAFAVIVQALAAYAGRLWDESMHLRVLAREIALWAVVTACADGYVLAEGVIRADGSAQPVLDRRQSWGAALRKNIATFEELVRTAQPGAGPLKDDLNALLRNVPARARGRTR